MTAAQRKYPIGIQSFREIREGGYLYVDKTAHIYRMTHADAKYMFLGRPRRFGKSLLTSTLHAYFEGQRELFGGLAIEQMEMEWQHYAVLHFDMSQGKHMQPERLNRYLHHLLQENEERLGVDVREAEDANIRLANLIKAACKQTGNKVVVLIDEYDAPMLDVAHDEQNVTELRQVMRNFFSPLKACDPYLRFVFLTGITKFSQMSLFSELNNIKNISMLPAYAAICGITQEELETQMGSDIDALAQRMGMTTGETLAMLKDRYDGYHFSWPSPDVYNPFSLLNAFSDGQMNAYWFDSGTPTYLIEMLHKFNVQPSEIGFMEATTSDFDAPTESMYNITPLLYQAGYLTIKGGNPQVGIYQLDVPNKEVRVGLMGSLLPGYVHGKSQQGNITITKMSMAIANGHIDDALRLLQTFLATVPYCDNTNYEGHYQQMLYVIFSMLSYGVDVEVRTPRGRVDMVVRAQKRLYLVELKLDKSAAVAMEQINLKNYAERFALCGLPITKVGVNFNSHTGNISDWEIQE